VTTPTPGTTGQPAPTDSVNPTAAIGGERLASMGLVSDLPAGVPAPPPLRDESWVLADLDTGEVLAAKAPHARLLPASTLKTLTALTLIPKLVASMTVKATAADASIDGTRVGLVPGLPYTVRELFQAMLMASGNDAAHALAQAAGGREATLAAMNSDAAYLGARDTVAKDPSGLDAPGETSSAYDLALIGRAALQLPQFRTYVATKQTSFPGKLDASTKKRASYIINNHNKLLYNYPGTIGVKNGYTVAAEHTFISAVTRGGKTYLLTEMHGLDTSWRPQAAMYDWAFAHAASARPIGQLVAPGSVMAKPSATTTTTADPSGLAGLAPAVRDGAAASLPSSHLLSREVAPWVGLAGLAAALLLVALFAGRAARRPSRRSTSRRRH
jgi:D-alanyl-D-alanine carboxypeptidase (penicillin-binding protein 5/6)